MNSFKEFKLPANLEKALQTMNCNKPTALQAQAIPAAMSNRDLMATASAGNGKILAFCLPMITRLLKSGNKGALILVSSDEIALEVLNVLKNLTADAPEVKSGALIDGGTLGMRPRILISTPTRLVEHLKKGAVSLSSMEILVLNGADQILAMGFQPQLNEILRFLPRSRQTILFSATLPADVVKMSEKWLREPVRVTIEQAPVAAKPAAAKPLGSKLVASKPVITKKIEQDDVLLSQLKAKKGSVLVFSRTKSRTDRLAKYLAEYGHPVARIKAIKGFRAGECRILVTTDIEAKTLDVSNIAHVINYDLLQ